MLSFILERICNSNCYIVKCIIDSNRIREQHNIEQYCNGYRERERNPHRVFFVERWSYKRGWCRS